MTQSATDHVVALVTGAARGIGAAVTRKLLESGVAVAAVDRLEQPLIETVGKLRAEGHTVRAYPADVSDRAAVAAVVESVETELGPIGILVNVAGVLRPGLVLDMADADWDETFAVNSNAVFVTAREVAQRMVPRRSGSIVTVGSNAAGVPRKRMAAYAASKAAATMFTRCLGLELAEYGIRCNIVSPGSTDTDMQRALWPEDRSADEAVAGVVAGSLPDFRVGIPLGRLAEPDDIAEAVLFLVSERARHITMHDLYVDGGATLRA
ncbi:2,3-dihydro-2,3-dihydroxybenzoate dehydrogenase [Actinosynnema sp. ALI-1.44]|uniref:2,3-dihydro-2,3-dihydroxybenzoate dehydrogenase n=1 Tax=Actinosynnema sp. ALI-1.44 TaxID=1933779 RepID=UPI00097CB18D|nr:2,3-dihydro-2,3-dihydroxybenzoate dehydrogenase [Actinosynnema sp. ALI-1.44]ONI75157.1 2,3-dihydro-2,3-dihydroxybenzoate dehydrogenase [Actinosynnema sp. ALI-1.44]